MNDKVAVFGQRRAGVYLLSEIYNPDNVKSSVQNVGTVIPAVGSLVVDDSVTEHNTLYVVYSVDAVTFKTTLVPAAVPANTDLGDDQIITYGNNVYMLFYETKVITLADSTNKTFWQHMVDNKICIFGTSAVSYSIYKGSSIDTTAEIITDYYYEDNVFTKSDNGKVPMDQIEVPTTNSNGVTITTHAMLPRIAYSETEITQGEFYTFVAFDKDNRAIAQIVLVAHPTLGIASLVSTQNPIESFKISSNQYDSSDNMHYLLRGQSVDELHFYPDIIWSNGDQNISTQIDNTQLFIYGMEEISTAVANNVYEVLFKYYLGNTETSLTGKNYSIGETGRYIYTTVKVKIISPYTSKISKLALLTKVTTDKKYDILPVIFYNDRSASPTIVSNTDFIASDFDNDLYNTPQTLKLRTYEQLSGDVQQSPYYQSYQMTLFNPDVVTDNVLYYFRDEPSTTGNFYGKNSITMPRPVINFQPDRYSYYPASGKFLANVDYYTRTGSGTTEDPYVYTKVTVTVGADIPDGYFTLEHDRTKCYYIPNTTFQSTQMFLNSFYFKADPPLVNGELTLKTPTHFTIRQIQIGATPSVSNINVVLPSPVKVENYGSNLALTTELFVEGNYPNTCMVEFLYSEDDTNFEHLYGVPVEILKADQSVVETGDSFRDNLYFTFMKPTTAEVEQYKLTYTGTDANRGFNRTWKYTGPGETLIVTLRYDKSNECWELKYTNGSTVKTWTVACYDDLLNVCELAWNYTNNWIYDNEVTLTKKIIDTDLVQYVAFDTAQTVGGLITKHPTITAPAKYIIDAEHGAYLLLNFDGTASSKTTGFVSTTAHASWLAWNRDFTIEMWINSQYNNLCETILSSNADCQFALGENIGSTSTKYHMMLSNYEATSSDNTWLNPPGGYTGTVAKSYISKNTWQHIAVTHSATTKTYTMYIDGVKVATVTPTTETSARPFWYNNFLQIAKWATNIVPGDAGRIAQNFAIHGFRLCRSIRYLDTFTPQWDVTQYPVYPSIGEIPTDQIDEYTRQETHYSITVGTWTNATGRPAQIYMNGSADDAMEIRQVNGSSYTTLWTDHDPNVSGQTHSYYNKLVCTVPTGASIEILLWDTAWVGVKWRGQVLYQTV